MVAMRKKLLLALITTGIIIGTACCSSPKEEKEVHIKNVVTETESSNEKAIEAEKISEKNTSEKEYISTETADEQIIYSYLQGVKSYEKGLKWTGDWCNISAGNQTFSQFGCGICCLSNMYSTFSEEECDPSLMYELCKEYTDYNPDSGVGALSWSQIDTMCHKLDCPGTLAKKPDDYSEFQKMAKENTTLLVLVSSNNDTAIWKDVPGHYVNLWLYDESSDQVFLTDSKGPKRNRTYVDLQDVYNALKTSSSYQIYIIP